MRETFNFNLRDDNGVWIATCKAPGFVVTKNSKEDAIQEALARWVRHLRTISKYPSGKPVVESIEVISDPRPMRKFGGRPIVNKRPNQTVHAMVEC